MSSRQANTAGLSPISRQVILSYKSEVSPFHWSFLASRLKPGFLVRHPKVHILAASP